MEQLQVALDLVTREACLLVEHPEGTVIAPGGGTSDWKAVVRLFYRDPSMIGFVHDASADVRTWNESNGWFEPSSWRNTRISIVDPFEGRILGTCQLNDRAGLLPGVHAALSDRRRN